MPERKPSSREKIIASALSLFSEQGVTAATTKQIAENAGVNEVTLFRQFGSKQGLLLAVLQEAPIAQKMQAALSEITGASKPLEAYGAAGLELIMSVPELVRSLIGESGQLPLDNQQALGKALRQANQQTTSYLQNAQIVFPGLSVEAGAKLLNAMLLGYAVMEFTGDRNGLWQEETEFLQALSALMSQKADASATQPTEIVEDLPADTVQLLFQKARKLGPQAYALVYVAFGAGLRTEEIAGLMRSHSISSKIQHLLTITGNKHRQVPLNRWIMGNRYGSYAKNPLTQWLKNRSDEQPEIFIGEEGMPLKEGIEALWNAVVRQSNSDESNHPITLFQARQTWCIELLTKGMSLDNLSILSGLSLTELEPYARRAKEKTALEQALAIDQKG